MNKDRLLKLITIMRRHSDQDHRLSIGDIIERLEEEGIPVANRKTIYDDLKVLSSFGSEIEYDNGYYLSDDPFSLSEVKIIIDSLTSLKNLDDDVLEDLKEKIYSFISVYEEKDLRLLEYDTQRRNSHFINRMEDILNAIRSHIELLIKRKGKAEELIDPLFLHRQNDYYYLYYHYSGSDKIYHTRLDNISQTRLTQQKSQLVIAPQKVIDHINESTDSFHQGKAKIIRFAILKDSPLLRQRLQDDFPSLTFTRNGFYVKVSISPLFYAKIAAYGDEIKISDPEAAESYIEYLEKLISSNR